MYTHINIHIHTNKIHIYICVCIYTYKCVCMSSITGKQRIHSNILKYKVYIVIYTYTYTFSTKSAWGACRAPGHRGRPRLLGLWAGVITVTKILSEFKDTEKFAKVFPRGFPSAHTRAWIWQNPPAVPDQDWVKTYIKQHELPSARKGLALQVHHSPQWGIQSLTLALSFSLAYTACRRKAVG